MGCDNKIVLTWEKKEHKVWQSIGQSLNTWTSYGGRFSYSFY